jgi:transcriptional regulator with XRE-family HTH domain
MRHSPARKLTLQDRDLSQPKEPADIVRAWLPYLKDKHRLRSDREIATRSGLSPTTVYRWMDPAAPFVMSLSKLKQVADAFGEPLPAGLAEVGGGFAETELTPYIGPIEVLPENAENNHGRWMLNSEVLNLEGFRPGDVLDFVLGAKPERGDIVVAQLRDQQRGTAQTVLRQYQPPFLLTRSSDPGIDPAPVTVDEVNVYIMGVFDQMVRRRRVA